MNTALKQYIQEVFGITVTQAKQLDGYDNSNYLIVADNTNYIFKTYGYTTALFDLVQAENEALLHVAKSLNTKSPQPLKAKNGAYATRMPAENGDKICRLLTYVDGSFLGDVTHTEPLITAFGTFLAKLDVELQLVNNYTIQSRSWPWDIKCFELNKAYMEAIPLAKDRHVVLYFFQQFEAMVRPHFPELRQQIIHNDANEWNVLVTEHAVSGIIDFGDIAQSFLINEVAVALTYVCYDKEDPLRWASVFLKAYHKVLPLKPLEIELLYYLIAARLCISVCNSAYAKQENPTNTYASVSEVSAWGMLYRWLAIGPIKATNSFKEAVGFELTTLLPIDKVITRRHQHISSILSMSYDTPIYMERSAFQYMYANDGTTFLDAYNNIPHVGHSHPKVVAAGQQQMAILNTNTRYLYDNLASYAERLLSKFPPSLNKVFFVNSGSAASDLAIRMAKFHTGKSHVMVVEQGYHGNTQTSIDISDYKFNNPKGQGQKPYILKTALPDAYKGKYAGDNDTIGASYASDALNDMEPFKNNVAAFIAEPIVGCAGQVPLADGYLKAVYPAIRKQGGVCISDEVQTGFGRLGNYFWGYEMHGVIPDMVVLGKPIANGHPMGAVVCTDEIAASFEKGVEFFSSFGGNPVSCAIAEAVLEVIEEEELQQNAKETGDYYASLFRDLMHKYPCIGDVRGAGLFLGIEIVKDGTKLPNTDLAHLIKNELKGLHVLISTDGQFDNVLKTKPALCFTKANAKRVVDTIDRVLKAYYEHL
ncbi:aminotransferase class III-fold pyridoxal phosphate-dependent enzyme [Hyunsoonleella ulvae]|uniref:aminotransferase class III-fold pyridoxal phosphate-dependent enzyme n=1 Tax=Hyunsoonleella ulvae TaxID=2799948 RepID=UPI00193A4133|nr:aminotransferase class III-fold pyridoxal phosphate-dependent enzyme [Hyunsoonleella ulvae]